MSINRDSREEKSNELARLGEEVAGLRESPLFEYRQKNKFHPVFGEGNPEAAVMFIGEAPGKQEAIKGRPFVGASGRVLNELLNGIGLEREDIYITNVVKDRPPKNRDPRRDEIELYSPFLSKQIGIIQPKVIATLGRFAMEFVLEQMGAAEQGQQISKLHGRPIKATAEFGPVTILPLYHPAVALYNRDQKQTLEDDFQALKRLIQLP